jgi:hypothetical protein
MHPETVSINLSSPFPYGAGAILIATLAYPTDRSLRDQFFRAICRSRVLNRSIKDEVYRTNLQLIPPAIFLGDNAKLPGVLDKGIEQVRRRIVVSFSVLLPYLAQVQVDGKILNVEELSKIATIFLGWSSGSSSNVISKVWVQTRSIAHVAIVYLCWLVTHVTLPNFSFELCPEPRFVAAMIKGSEELRFKLSAIKRDSQPLIREDEMIKFLLLTDNGTLYEL